MWQVRKDSWAISDTRQVKTAVFAAVGCSLKLNKMEPTNPNANTCSKTNTQTIFDTLVGDIFVGRSCRTHSFRNALWDTLVHSCGTLLPNTFVGHSCGTVLYRTLVGHSCGGY